MSEQGYPPEHPAPGHSSAPGSHPGHPQPPQPPQPPAPHQAVPPRQPVPPQQPAPAQGQWGAGQTPPPGAPYPYAYPYYPGVAPVPPAQPPANRGRRGLWITLAIVLVLGCIVASCVLPLALVSSDTGTATTFGDAVGVIRMDGVIAGSGDVYSGYITPRDFNDQLQQAIDDEAVKAIVLDVECPGGTVAASEEIARYIKQCPKPVVVSVGDVGASGAYMVASQADEIWAMPGSTVGSIGVIAEIPNASGLLDKLGVEFNVITAGKYKDAGSPYRPMSEEERALIQGSVDEAYDQFIDIVADGRDMPRSKVETLATGWAWSGAEAKRLGLVDELGTYEDALDAAAKRGGIKGDYDVVTYYDQFPSFLEALIGLNTRLSALEALGREASGTNLERPLPR